MNERVANAALTVHFLQACTVLTDSFVQEYEAELQIYVTPGSGQHDTAVRQEVSSVDLTCCLSS